MTLSLTRIRELRAQWMAEAREATDKLRTDDAREALDMASALAAAEALARLEAWLRDPDSEVATLDAPTTAGPIYVQLKQGGTPDRGVGPDLLTALTRALDEAEAGA